WSGGRSRPLPDREVVGEQNPPGVELVETPDPFGVRTVALALSVEQVCMVGDGEVRGAVERLAGQDHPAAFRLDDERLVAGNMAGRRDNANARQWIGLAIEQLETRVGEIGHLVGSRVVLGISSVVLALLGKDRGPRKQVV